MIVRVQREPLCARSDRLLRLQGLGLIALGVTGLCLWNPLTTPGPRMCLLRHAVGLPCPLCGMTRGVALCLRGHLHQASLFNPLSGPVLALALVLAIKWAIELMGGWRFALHLPAWMARALPRLVWLIFLTNWIYLLVFRREDAFPTTWLGQVWLALTSNS